MVRKPKKPPREKFLRLGEQKSGHLKEFSSGKPNEISFNVLENMASAQAPKKESRFGRLFKRDRGSAEGLPDSMVLQGQGGNLDLVEPSSITNPTPVPTPSVSRETPFMGVEQHAEIERRQARRRASRILSIVAVLAIVVALVGFGATSLYKAHEKQMTYIELLQRACGFIESSDQTMVSIDEFLQTPFGEDTVSRAEELLGQIPAAKKELESAHADAYRAHEQLADSTRDKEAAEHAMQTIAARESLFDTAELILNNDIAAKQAMELMTSAWAYIEEANSLLAQAGGVTITEDNAEQSTAFTTEARTKLAAAQADLKKVAELYPTADLSLAQSYVELRIEAADEALASDAAILLRDRATAEKHNEAYNAADLKAVEIAEQLPADFAQPLIDAYVADSTALMQQYESARADIGRHDSFLRDYLASV